MLRDRLFERLQGVAGASVILNGPDFEARHPGNLNLQFVGFDARDIIATSQPRLAASTGSACTSGIEEPSHVLTGIGLDRHAAAASLRLCVGRYTTAQDVDDAASLLGDALQSLTMPSDDRLSLTAL